MAALPTKGKGPFAGFVADLDKVRAVDPEANPAAAIGAILQGGYPAIVRSRYYERPENRIADIEQLSVLAARYDSLEKLIADLLLAGDVYGLDSVEADAQRFGRDPRPQHDPPGQGAGVVARVPAPAARGGLPLGP